MQVPYETIEQGVRLSIFGMLGIFMVLSVIMVAVIVLNYFSKGENGSE